MERIGGVPASCASLSASSRREFGRLRADTIGQRGGEPASFANLFAGGRCRSGHRIGARAHQFRALAAVRWKPACSDASAQFFENRLTLPRAKSIHIGKPHPAINAPAKCGQRSFADAMVSCSGSAAGSPIIQRPTCHSGALDRG